MAEAFNTDQLIDYVRSSQLESLMNDLDSFITKRSAGNPTFKLWMIFLEMVQILLLFLRATRENNGELHLFSIRSMLPWLFVTDRTNYCRYGTSYWLVISSIGHTHPGMIPFFTYL